MNRFRRCLRSYSIPLAPSEFRSALRRGLGRAYLHARRVGPEACRDEILRACLLNHVYDPQCEVPRAQWLMGLLDEAGQTELLHRLEVALPRAREARHVYQMCELCKVLVLRGHPSDRELLYQNVRELSDGEWAGVQEIFELDDLAGLARLAQMTPGSLVGTDWSGEAGLGQLMVRAREHFEDLGGLRAFCEGVPSLRPYLGLLEDDSHEDPFPPPTLPPENLAELSASEFVALIDGGEKTAYFPLTFAWMRTVDEQKLGDLAALLPSQSSANRLRQILTVFTRHRLPPVVAADCLAFLDHPDWHVRTKAHTALGLVRHPAIRERALLALSQRRWLHKELDLFCANLEAEDAALFQAHLQVERRPDDHHRLSSSLGDICQANPEPSFVGLMAFVYETAPSTNVRSRVFEVMEKARCTPPWISAEWEHDVVHTWD